MPSTELIKQLKSKKYPAILFLQGEESYYIDKIAYVAENELLTEAEQSFDLTIAYGKEISGRQILDVATRYPIVAERQIVIIKEAQDFKEHAELLAYVKKPTPTTLLIFCHKNGKLDARTTFSKALKEHAVIFESNKVPDYKLNEWIGQLLAFKKIAIKPDAEQLLAEYLGNDLTKINNEVEKLALNLKPGEVVTTALIEKFIGISKEYNFFELQKALANREKEKIYNILHYFDQQPKQFSIVPAIATLYGFFSKVYMLAFTVGKTDAEICKELGIPPFFLKDYKLALKNYPPPRPQTILHLFQEYDLKSKGVNQSNISDSELLKELTWKILHC